MPQTEKRNTIQPKPLSVKLQFLRRLKEKGLISNQYTGTLIIVYKVANQPYLFFTYHKNINKILLDENSKNESLSIANGLNLEQFLIKINNPQLKQELLFNLNLFL